MPLHPWPPSENSLKPTCTPKHIHPSLNHPPGVLRGVRPLLCPWTQNFVDCFLFCCALESSCLGRLSAIKVQLELELGRQKQARTSTVHLTSPMLRNLHNTTQKKRLIKCSKQSAAVTQCLHHLLRSGIS